jgi:hypothetical protein
MLNKITFYLLGGVLALSLFTHGHASASGSIFFDPSTINASNNNLVTINVKISTSIAFNAAQVDLTYDASSLEYVSYSMAGSVLPTMFNFQNNNGSIKSTLFTGGGSTSMGENQQLVAFNFKTVKDTANSIISFQPSTIALNGTQTSATAGSQASIVISPNQTDSSPNVIPVQNNQAPKILSNTLSGTFGGNISVNITTDKPTIATLNYGTKDVLGNSANSSELKSEHLINLGDISTTFEQSNDYYYKVEVVDEFGNKASSDNIKIDLKPTSVSLTIKDNNGKILPGAVIKINEVEYTADENGQIIIEGLLPGTFLVYTKQPNGEFKLIGDATLKSTSAQQQFEVTPNAIINNTPIDYAKLIPVILIGFASLIALFLVSIKLLKSYKKHKEERLHSANPWGHKVNFKPNLGVQPIVNNQPQPLNPDNNITDVVNNSINISKTMASNEASPELNKYAPSQPVLGQENNHNNSNINNTSPQSSVTTNTQQIDPNPMPINNTTNKIIVGDAINDD